MDHSPKFVKFVCVVTRTTQGWHRVRCVGGANAVRISIWFWLMVMMAVGVVMR